MAGMNLDGILAKLKIDPTKKETMIFLVMLLVAVLVIYFSVFIKPKVSVLLKHFREIPKAQRQIKAIKDDLARKGRLEKRLVDLRQKFTKFENKLPAENDRPMLLKDLSATAKETNVTILGLSPVGGKGTKSGTPYVEVPIRISAVCGYHELGAFINKMENAERFKKIPSLTITTNRSSPSRHNINLVVNTYILLLE